VSEGGGDIKRATNLNIVRTFKLTSDNLATNYVLTV